ncbi:hypothetical protein CMV_019876 [Castanea mollissima]|uniref:Uncharacterized protein n=1 Tax=Castanea mollissima TaxID=60419 RepID=A0A8J4QXK8_9ROSI|nr:hypothetical protein CMV_019876 [Castanea mollissima]
MALQPTMAFKGPMPPNTSRVSNIDEGVSEEDIHLLLSTFGFLEWIKFQTTTCALVKFINFYHGATCQQFHAGWMHTLQLLACLQEPLVWARSFPVVSWDLLD